MIGARGPDLALLEKELRDLGATAPRDVVVLAEIDSTSDELKRRLRAGAAGPGTLVIAETQTAGRGRLGRAWWSPPAGHLYASLAVAVPGPPDERVPLVPLAAGAAAADALAALDVRGVLLKWPNDLLRGGRKVAIFSLEMAAEQLVRRLLSSEARVDQKRISGGYLAKSDWPKLELASQALRGIDLWIVDTPGITPLELSAKARRLKQEHGLDLVMVDYLQLMSGGARFNSRNEEVSAISRNLKAVAKELDVPLLVLSQLSRQPERRGGDHRPQLSDLRESGSIEQDADVVLFIVRPSVYDRDAEDPRHAELIIAKQRNGPIGEIDLVFQHEYTRFENADFAHTDAEAPW